MAFEDAVAELETVQKSPEAALLLNEVRDYISNFCSFPDKHCLHAVTLWTAHTHMAEHFYTTPRLALTSPEAGSGKTRVLDVLDLLVPNSLKSISASPAAIFRTLNKGMVTLLLDECDAIWSKRGKDDNHEDLRALLNAGYKQGAKIPRCVGPSHDVVDFPVFCPVALAGLGNLPDTILTRSVIIKMRRRAPHETVESFRSREQEPIAARLQERLAAWGDDVGEAVGKAWPALPAGITDRPAEIWEPLIAVADAAGGGWPKVARDAAVALCKVAQEGKVSLGVRLLHDLRTIFGPSIALHTQTILDRLKAGEDLDADAPWGDLYSRGLSERDLAGMLKPYDVSSVKVNVAGRSLMGYRAEHLHDPWLRYVPSYSGKEECPEPPEPFSGHKGSEGSGGSPFPDDEEGF